jgi:DNA-binding response OmpR family regulator
LLVVAVGDPGVVERRLVELSTVGATVVIAPDRASAARLLWDTDPGSRPEDDLTLGALTVSLEDLCVTWRGSMLPLSPSEVRMLALLAVDPGRVRSFSEITEKTWGYRYLGDSSSVRSAVKRLRRKLADAASTVTIESVWGVGFRLT